MFIVVSCWPGSRPLASGSLSIMDPHCIFSWVFLSRKSCCYGSPGPQSQSLHILQQVIDGIDAEEDQLKALEMGLGGSWVVGSRPPLNHTLQVKVRDNSFRHVVSAGTNSSVPIPLGPISLGQGATLLLRKPMRGGTSPPMACGGNMGHRFQHRPPWWKDQRPRHSPQMQLGPRCHYMTLDGNAYQSDWYGPCNSMTLGHRCGFGLQSSLHGHRW